jgi:hypothetical protein
MIKDSVVMVIAAAGVLWALPEAVVAQDPRLGQQPLEPGHSAGVQAAQQTPTGLALIGTATIVAVVIVAATTSNGSGNNNQVNMPSAPATTTS